MPLDDILVLPWNIADEIAAVLQPMREWDGRWWPPFPGSRRGRCSGMRIEPTPLQGLVVVAPEPVEDERGLFARTWCADAFAGAGIAFRPFSRRLVERGGATLRGLHWQAPPHAEAKLVRVTAGPSSTSRSICGPAHRRGDGGMA